VTAVDPSRPERPHVRRVVTAQTDQGSTFAVDENVDYAVNGATGFAYWQIWGADEKPVLPARGIASTSYARTTFPVTPDGYRVHIIEFPALGESADAIGDWPPNGLGPHDQHHDPETGMHWTSTIDIMVVLSGHIGLEQDDGLTILGPGDVLVQNGATHAWRLQSERCRVCFVTQRAPRQS
jgi:hypothetical protein